MYITEYISIISTLEQEATLQRNNNVNISNSRAVGLNESPPVMDLLKRSAFSKLLNEIHDDSHYFHACLYVHVYHCGSVNHVVHPIRLTFEWLSQYACRVSDHFSGLSLAACAIARSKRRMSEMRFDPWTVNSLARIARRVHFDPLFCSHAP